MAINKKRIQCNGHVARPLRQQQHQHATGTAHHRMEVSRFLQPGAWGGGFHRIKDPSRLHIARPSTQPSPIRSSTAPISPRTPSIARRALKGWSPTQNWPGESCPHQRSIQINRARAPSTPHPVTEEETGEESVLVPRVDTEAEQTSSKGGNH